MLPFSFRHYAYLFYTALQRDRRAFVRAYRPSVLPLGHTGSTPLSTITEKDEINVPIALSAFRDKGSRLWSFEKRERKIKKKKVKFS